MRINYSIIFVSDMDRSIAFYRDIIGMPVKFETPFWTEFATEGATWALHKSDSTPLDEQRSGLESPGMCRAGFHVANLDAFHQLMMDHQVPCQQEPTELFGSRIAQYRDPDGMVFSVSGD